MDKKYIIYEAVGFIVTSLAAAGLHFLYAALPCALTALISPVNESVWEHVKIVFCPFLIWSIIELIMLRPADKRAFLGAKCVGLALLPIVLIVFFYTYSGIVGRNIAVVDIASTFLHLLTAFIASALAYKKETRRLRIVCAAICAVFLFFIIIFTFCPPHIALFKDPISGSYGISA